MYGYSLEELTPAQIEAGREVYRKLRANLESALRPRRSASAAEVKEQEKEPAKKWPTVETPLSLGLTYPADGQVPCLVDRVTVRRDGQVAQFVAAEPLRAGDLIAWEKPLLFVTSVGGYAACDYCGADCSDIRRVSCRGCSSTVGFCNAECRKRAYAGYHWLECLMSNGGIKWFKEEIRLALRLFCLGLTVYEKDFGRLYQRYKSVTSVKSADDPLSSFAGTDHSLKDRHDALFRLPFDEQVARKLCSELFHQLMTKYCRQLASVLRMTNIECNGTHLKELTQYYHFVSAETKQKSVRPIPIGLLKTEVKDRLDKGDGIYPIMSLFRHSCNANVKLISTADNRQMAFVLRPTAKGEPLTLAKQHYFVRNREERRLKVQSIYGSQCVCDACRYNYPQSHCVVPVTHCSDEQRMVLQDWLNSAGVMTPPYSAEFLQYQMKFEYALMWKYTDTRVRLAINGGAAELDVWKVPNSPSSGVDKENRESAEQQDERNRSGVPKRHKRKRNP